MRVKVQQPHIEGEREFFRDRVVPAASRDVDVAGFERESPGTAGCGFLRKEDPDGGMDGLVTSRRPQLHLYDEISARHDMPAHAFWLHPGGRGRHPHPKAIARI